MMHSCSGRDSYSTEAYTRNRMLHKQANAATIATAINQSSQINSNTTLHVLFSLVQLPKSAT